MLLAVDNSLFCGRSHRVSHPGCNDAAGNPRDHLAARDRTPREVARKPVKGTACHPRTRPVNDRS
jgi:hypothetical protein